MAGLTVVSLLLGAGIAGADAWNDRTTLTFSEPVMVPGATLSPGTYVFRLVDSRANRHLVRITSEDESRIIATAQAIPVKRENSEDTTTLTFGATPSYAPPALKAWYYPGSLYGHEFVYPADQAKEIAAREKTLVLSDDESAQTADGASTGELRVYDADGSTQAWKADESVIREWRDWTRGDAAKARTVTQTADDEARREAAAPMMNADRTAMTVEVDSLEDDASKYTGKTIRVSGEVEKILGPRLFTIDEPHWADLDGEVLVHMPTALATLVRPDDLITVIGTVQPFVVGTLDEEWSWFADDSEDVTMRFENRPVIVATQVLGGDDDRALFIARPSGDTLARGDGRDTAATPNNDDAARPDRDDSATTADDDRQAPGATQASRLPVGEVMHITSAAVGRTVELDDVNVQRVVAGRGFIVEAGDRSVFVRRADGRTPSVQPGETVSIDGFVLAMPPAMRDSDSFRDMGRAGTGVYVYATDVS